MISVIIPVYNTAKFLSTCIRSIINQTLQELEIIIVNDASTDKSIYICNKFKEKDNRIILIDKKQNEGVEKARYDGILAATGEYICFVDSDDWLEKDALKRMYDKALETDADYVEVGMQRVLDRHKIIKKKTYPAVKGLITQPQLFDSYYISFFGMNILSVNIWGKLYRGCILKNPPQPIGLTMGEDLYFNLEIFPRLKTIYIDDYIGYNYRFGGMTTRYNKNLLSNLKILYSIKKKKIEKYHYYKASDYIRIELKNALMSDINQRILFRYGPKQDIIDQIYKELMDPIWNDIQQIQNFPNTLSSPIVQAIINKDTNTIYEICKINTNKYYPQWLAKRMMSKILNII
ncbi:glycosyltransferase family 2 protein [Phocaeicola coprocola]|uniref:glycosyltransferase family 2 protein n=1 Tax=Phocaeicola coprocola TaxID=310298 RepID=UPI00242BEE8B|nr:glycosyltransferase family 2 protein [Phocaeicola coprocola]